MGTVWNRARGLNPDITGNISRILLTKQKDLGKALAEMSGVKAADPDPVRARLFRVMDEILPQTV